jgi:hypothetical protein
MAGDGGAAHWVAEEQERTMACAREAHQFMFSPNFEIQNISLPSA